ncbi:hypothetical protein RchiOBHm_Chr2g0101941 [Rosa chinensis]|uniref:Uncharacterized protein n=1 Tax=Rosa chinensis TaxID=74649 RepID=A0A2P6RMJ2_ROSCH|nr:uncharacterized protein LOC112186544 [Rosa chinensis]PRQ47645.1 hypothetical protein RchiOBHm_Chr2g0101941 [Rosa chinensis]
MEGASQLVRTGRKSSIESEPRTLRFHQIQYAREAAEYVMNTKDLEEAKRIFTQGLQPVVSVMKPTGEEMTDSVDEFEYSEDRYRLSELRDVVTAPF